jgi:hypothetical protein
VSDQLGSSVSVTLSGEGQPAPPPPTELLLDPAGGFSFAPALVGASVSQTVTITNPADVPTGPLGTSVLVCDYYYYYNYGCSPSTIFLLEDDHCAGMSLPAGGSCKVTIVFRPTYVGSATATFGVSAPGFTGSLVVFGSATGLHTSTSSVNFAPTVVGNTSGSQTILITNSGPSSTGPLATEVSGFVFEFSSDTCAGTSLAPGGFCTIAVRFRPTAPGTRFGSVGVSATPGGTVQIQLSGTGL